MKAKFRKLDMLTYHRDRDRITFMLQELGVVHLEFDNDFRSEGIEDLERQKSRLTKAIEFIKEFYEKKGKTPSISSLKGEPIDAVLDNILDLKNQKEALYQEGEILRKNIQKLQPWGDFDFEKVSRLKSSGIYVSFYIVEKREFKEEDFAQLTYQIIHEGPDHLYLVVLSKDEVISLPFEMVQLPPIRMASVLTQEENLNKSKEEIADKMKAYLPHLPLLYEEQVRVDNQWMLQMAYGSYHEYGSGTILHLKGWFPANMEDRLRHFIDKEQLSYIISDPADGEVVPVLLNNPKYPKLFEAITRIFQLPGYYEMDLTPFIAVFYPILFAYCLGDAGYGLILTLAALIGWFTFLKSSRNMAVLGVVLGVFTSLMGVVKSGSIFGQPIVESESVPFLSYLSQYVVIPDDRGVVFNAFNVALMIGVVQIFVGILISIFNKIRYKSLLASLPQIGKFLIVFSLIWIFLADMQQVEVFKPLGVLRKVLLVSGVLLVLFFHDMKLSVVSRAASGILPLFFILTGILGDVLSYVRLFALGVASSVLGLVVNQIGLQIMGDAWWGIALGIIFLLIGHGLNFALATLGAFVHPLRLTFVEFYNNAQFEGGGVPYKPLRKNKYMT